MPAVPLDASNSTQADDLAALWHTNDGHFSGDSTGWMAAADRAGTYFFTLTDTLAGCSTTDSVVVTGEAVFPDADAGLPQTLTCETPVLTLSGQVSTGSNLFFEWDTEDGHIVSGAQTLQPIVDAPGTYELVVWNELTDCETTATVTIDADFKTPHAEAGKDVQLNCLAPAATLNGNASTAGNFLYAWHSPDGHILAGADGLTPTVDAPGLYFLTVTNLDNGCVGMDSVWAFADMEAPQLTILPAPTFTCATSFLILDATNSSTGSQFSFVWDTDEGLLLSGKNSPSPVVGAPGEYVLTLTNLVNGCTAAGAVTVPADTLAPDFEILAPLLLTCVRSEVFLQSSAGTAANFLFDWTTSDGHLVTPNNAPTALADAPGTYQLTILNISNGCQSTQKATVIEDRQPPDVVVGDTLVLPCDGAPVRLSGAAPGTPDPVFEWNTPDGHFASDPNAPDPLVDAPGTYVLTVTNAQNGCSDTGETTVSVPVSLSFEAKTISPDCGATFGQIIFGDVWNGAPPFVFSVDGGAHFSSHPVFDSLPPGNYVLMVQDLEGCESLQNVTLTDAATPTVGLEREVSLTWGDFYKIKPKIHFPDTDIVAINWTPTLEIDCPTCLMPVVRPTEDRIYRLELTLASGCVTTAETAFRVEKPTDFFVPNAFSPDGDGVNDRLILYARPNTVRRIRSFVVADRWGGVVFSAKNIPPNDPSAGWDGQTSSTPAPTGVYIWTTEIEWMDGRRQVWSGDVLLTRKR